MKFILILFGNIKLFPKVNKSYGYMYNPVISLFHYFRYFHLFNILTFSNMIDDSFQLMIHSICNTFSDIRDILLAVFIFLLIGYY